MCYERVCLDKNKVATVPSGVRSPKQPGVRRAGPTGGRSPPRLRGPRMAVLEALRQRRQATVARRHGAGPAQQDGG